MHYVEFHNTGFLGSKKLPKYEIKKARNSTSERNDQQYSVNFTILNVRKDTIVLHFYQKIC